MSFFVHIFELQICLLEMNYINIANETINAAQHDINGLKELHIISCHKVIMQICATDVNDITITCNINELIAKSTMLIGAQNINKLIVDNYCKTCS